MNVVIDYHNLFNKYLNLLEVGKSYKLGAIFQRLQEKKEPVDIEFLFLYLKTDSRFSVKVVSFDLEAAIVKRISL